MKKVGRNLLFVRDGVRYSSAADAGVAIRHNMPGSDDGLDFQAICSPEGTHVREVALD